MKDESKAKWEESAGVKISEGGHIVCKIVSNSKLDVSIYSSDAEILEHRRLQILSLPDMVAFLKRITADENRYSVPPEFIDSAESILREIREIK